MVRDPAGGSAQPRRPPRPPRPHFDAASPGRWRRPSPLIAPCEAERRQVTVLVCGCHQFESESYLGLDTEDQAQVLREFEEACEKTVRQFGGTTLQCNEQGLLACFRLPG